MASAASRLAWNISVVNIVNIVDIAVACLIDFATASRGLERVATDINSCWRYKYAANVNKPAWELIATSLWAFFSNASKFFIGIADLSLLDKSNKEASASIELEHCLSEGIGSDSCKTWLVQGM